jgi:hypothetical protein
VSRQQGRRDSLKLGRCLSVWLDAVWRAAGLPALDRAGDLHVVDGDRVELVKNLAGVGGHDFGNHRRLVSGTACDVSPPLDGELHVHRRRVGDAGDRVDGDVATARQLAPVQAGVDQGPASVGRAVYTVTVTILASPV